MQQILPSKTAELIIKAEQEKKSNYWERQEQRNAMTLFHAAAKRVPAYKHFLKDHHINAAKITRYKDFQQIPSTDKKNYLHKYSLADLCWDGSLKKPIVITSTSGSTGAPYYFPRTNKLDWQYSVLVERFLKTSSLQSGGPILVIIGFGMGVWIAGLISYKAFEIASLRQHLPISIITPGINKKEIFSALKNISPYYKEVILVGYPPFLKDIIDEAPDYKINLRKINLRLLSAAEAFTEKFRDYLVKKSGINSAYYDTSNIYGSADIGAMASETPGCILIRKLAQDDQSLFKNIFSSISKTPTLAQYNPTFISFEAPKGRLLLTGDNCIPLIRYSIGDHGGVLQFNKMSNIIKDHHYDLSAIAKEHDVKAKDILQLPFVYVYERIDLSTTLYGLQIYPETIKTILVEKPLNQYLTGKFTLITKFDKELNQYLEINLELKKGQRKTGPLIKNALKEIISNLQHQNAEFNELKNYLGTERDLIKLKLWPHEDPLYFKPGVKQMWIKK